jgi:hypothetical protein
MKLRILSWINVLLGLWLTLAPFALGYSSVHGAGAEDVLLGSGIVALALWRAVGADSPGMQGVSWTVAIAGIWVAAAPFALGYSAIAAAAVNELTVGLLIATFGIIRAFAPAPLKVA